MAGLQETITLDFAPASGSVESAGRALDGVAKRFRERLQDSYKGARETVGGAVGGYAGAVAGQAVGGQTGSALGQLAGTALGGVAGSALGAAVQGFGQGVRGLSPALASSPTAVAAYGALGAAQGVGDLAGYVPIVGPIVQGQINAFADAIRAPHERAAGRIAGFVGEAARYGVRFSDAQIEQASTREVLRERAAYTAEANAQRIAHRVGLSSGAVAFGLSQTGVN